jgi:hypothetical protein
VPCVRGIELCVHPAAMGLVRALYDFSGRVELLLTCHVSHPEGGRVRGGVRGVGSSSSLLGCVCPTRLSVTSVVEATVAVCSRWNSQSRWRQTEPTVKSARAAAERRARERREPGWVAKREGATMGPMVAPAEEVKGMHAP